MTWFNNRRILSKLMMLVTFMGIIIALVGSIGIHSLQTLDAKANDMEESAKEALLATGLLKNVLKADQLKMHIVGDPTAQKVEEAKNALDAEEKEFRQQIVTLEKTADAAQAAKLEKIKKSYDDFIAALGETLKVAATIKDFTLSTEQARVKDAAHSSDDESEALQQFVNKYSQDSSEDVSKLSDDITAIYENISRLMLVAVIGGILLGLLLGGLIAKYGIGKPIASMVALLQKLAKGEFDISIVGNERKDEVGDIARSAVIFRESGKENLRLEAQQKENERLAVIEKRATMDKLADDFESGVQGIISMVAAASTELYQTAENMKKTVALVSSESVAAASASQQTSGNVQSVSAAVEEMSSSIREIASQVSNSSAVVTETVSKASHADTTVQTLTEAVGQIGSISEMIQNIASQINLLALNATIESARAGEAGKGFAVVASEVKNLATQTSNATGQIAKQIENIKNVTQNVVSSLKDIQSSIGSVNQYSSGIASAIEEQSAATQEISSNMQQAARGVENIGHNIASISKGTNEADNGAQEVLSAAKMLSEQSEQLNSEVKKFIAGVRS